MNWIVNGQKQKEAFLAKIEGKLTDGKKLTGFERSLYRLETGLVDYTEADAGEERVIRNYE